MRPFIRTLFARIILRDKDEECENPIDEELKLDSEISKEMNGSINIQQKEDEEIDLDFGDSVFLLIAKNDTFIFPGC